MRKKYLTTMNLDDVAQEAGVSTSTVSRVLNNLKIVKTSTRSRVLRAVEELNYHPNLHARSLARGKSRILGIIVSNMENPFFLDIYRTLESDAHARGLEVVVANTGYRSQQLLASVQLMIGLRVAGLAVIVSEMEEHLIQTVAESHIPVTFYDVGAPQKNITNIRVDYGKGIKKTVSYLHSLGHRRMAFIGHHSALGPIGERRRAFLESVHRCSPNSEPSVFTGPDGFDGGCNAARELLDSGFHPTAVLCVNDFMAVGVMRKLREEGLQIPRDVSVTGFDGIKLAEFCSPPLTTVHIPREKIGHIIFDTVLGDSQNDNHSGHEIVIDPELVLRDSTGPALKG